MIRFLLLLAFTPLFHLHAQEFSLYHDTLANKAKQVVAEPQTKNIKISFSGMMLARYVYSANKEIDVNGKQYAAEGNYSASSFLLRRVRLQTKAKLAEKAEATLLLNLTDFLGNPQNKVLELAALKYHFNEYINFQVGQFRPYFGREDLYPEEQLKTLEWSNLYYAFGANGWQSFQMGATLLGKAKILNLPVSYFIGVFNGNGRNQPMDNDRGKLFPLRLELAVSPATKLGINAGAGKDQGEKVWAFSADADHKTSMGKRWTIEVQSEYKTGINNTLFCADAAINKFIRNYRLSGFYILPALQYKLKDSVFRSMEFSVRYENLNPDEKRNGNTKKTIIPMLGTQLADEYFLRLEIGMIIDRYSRNIPNTNQYNSTRFICQLQARF
jgi:hypothetical protein